MTAFQKVIKYLAIAFAVFLIVSIIGGVISAFGLIGGIIDGDGVAEDISVYTLSEDIRSLEVTVGAADFTITRGESFAVESNLKNLTVTEKDGKLVIKEKSKHFGSYKGPVLVLYVPEGTVFEKARIETGAGRLTVDALSADKISLELGAGEVSIDLLNAASSADIEGGVGKVTIADGTLNNLDLDMGVGKLDITAAIIGKSKLDLGVGESRITLVGNRDDYTVSVRKGIGSVTVDGKSASDRETFGDGQNTVDIDGGIGEISLSFKAAD